MSAVREERRRQQLSLRELAHFAGCSHTTIARIERGSDASPALKARIARVLRVPLEQIWPESEADREERGA